MNTKQIDCGSLTVTVDYYGGDVVPCDGHVTPDDLSAIEIQSVWVGDVDAYDLLDKLGAVKKMEQLLKD